ncbi:plasmid replication protein RepC [Leisingera sp. XS_AS12]|uniref:plasmid replication protein RepC n=1 Tax=Leisingera sp. XS_AS12 TaxID=3241294 RepID=UPI003519AF07
MGYMPITPFGRTVDAVLLQQQAAATEPSPAVDKWDALRALAAARKAYHLSDRDITVLQALLSFLPAKTLDTRTNPPVIHPSNRAICERLNGMPCSTMRRHVARLVQAGVLIRRDSPNGKRYVRRYQGERVAFGFDLTPLASRYGEFCAAAEAEREAQLELKRLRETVSLMRRDLASLTLCGMAEQPDLPVWNQYDDLAQLTARTLRRKLTLEQLRQLEIQLGEALEQLKSLLCPPRSTTETSVDAADLNTNDAENEQHYQNSKKDSFESEPQPLEDIEANQQTKIAETTDRPKALMASIDRPSNAQKNHGPKLPLRLVATTCTELATYAETPLTSWPDLMRTAETIRPMMGISPPVWEQAKRSMGATEAAVVLAAMLQRFSEIRSPNGYLRHLSAKAVEGQFTSAPMVMALARNEAA